MQRVKRLNKVTAEPTLEGVGAMNVMRKGRRERLNGRDSTGQVKFVAGLSCVAA